MSKRLEENKRVVREFCEMAFNEQRPAEAAARYLGPVYRQHSPSVAEGAESFIASVTGFAGVFPGLRLAIKRMIAEGDLVVVHSNITRHASDRGLAVVDIFRINQGRIVEHWDVIQEVPGAPLNNNTMF